MKRTRRKQKVRRHGRHKARRGRVGKPKVNFVDGVELTVGSKDFGITKFLEHGDTMEFRTKDHDVVVMCRRLSDSEIKRRNGPVS